MGDVAMTVPVIQLLSQTYPDLKITVLSRGFYKPFFKNIPNVSFYEADVYGRHKGFLGLNKLTKELKGLGIDVVADLHNVIRSKALTTLFRLNGIPSQKIDKGRIEKAKLIRANGSAIYPLKSTHHRYVEVFQKLGFPLDLSNWQKPLKPDLLENPKQWFGSDNLKKVGIAPFAAFPSKSYPLNQMKEVLKKLNTQATYSLYFFGGGSEEIQALNELASTFENAHNLAGKGSFEEELNCIANLDLMLSMDSGNGHLAAMFGVPVITLWGVTHPYAGFVPFNQPMENQLTADREKFPLIPTSIYGNKYPEAYENAIGSISPETIVKKIKEVLS